MIKVGAVDIDTSHPGNFAKIMLESGRAAYTAVYNQGFRGDDEVKSFMEKFNLEKRCGSVEELVEAVDVGFIHSCNWDKHVELARPFIEAGKPVFIDKPLAGNPADCRYFEEAARGGAVILGSSSVRYAEEITGLREKFGGEAGTPLNVFGTCGSDEFNYGIHIAEGIGGLLGKGAVSTRFAGRASLEDKKCETFFVKFESGATAVFNNFTGTWHPFDISVMTSVNTFSFRIATPKIYAALIGRILDFLETGADTLAPVDHLTESVKIMLAGRISRDEGGKEIPLASIPEDYPGFDGARFEAEYAARAKSGK